MVNNGHNIITILIIAVIIIKFNTDSSIYVTYYITHTYVAINNKLAHLAFSK